MAGLACTDMLLRQNSPLEKDWEGSPELSHKLRGLEATTGLQWDVQTLTIGADAIGEIFLPFRQARGNSAAISAMLCYYVDLGVIVCGWCGIWAAERHHIRSLLIIHQIG
jgi:hypothetical protein